LGAYVFGDGRLPGLQTVARSGQRSEGPAFHDRQGSVLRLLFSASPLGWVSVRVSPGLALRRPSSFKGLHWLARRLRRAGWPFRLAGNALVQCTAGQQAQARADDCWLDQRQWDGAALARQGGPGWRARFRSGYHWSLRPGEYCFDLVWPSAAKVTPVDEELSPQAILTVQAPEAAKFLGQRFSTHTDPALGSDLHPRVEGRRGQHFLGPARLKLSDKRGRGLRRACTVNDVPCFSPHRQVAQRAGPPT